MLARLSYGKPLGFRVKNWWWLFSSKRQTEIVFKLRQNLSHLILSAPAKVIPHFQYSSGNKNVVALRSASVMTQNFVPLLIV